jgi:hypothetical protein
VLLFSNYMLQTYNSQHIPSKQQILSSTGENTIDLDSVAGLTFCQVNLEEETYSSYQKRRAV